MINTRPLPIHYIDELYIVGTSIRLSYFVEKNQNCIKMPKLEFCGLVDSGGVVTWCGNLRHARILLHYNRQMHPSSDDLNNEMNEHPNIGYNYKLLMTNAPMIKVSRWMTTHGLKKKPVVNCSWRKDCVGRDQNYSFYWFKSMFGQAWHRNDWKIYHGIHIVIFMNE